MEKRQTKASDANNNYVLFDFVCFYASYVCARSRWNASRGNVGALSEPRFTNVLTIQPLWNLTPAILISYKTGQLILVNV